MPCASRRMRTGTNSGIHALKQWCLAPAFGCDARRALRRVVALDRASMRYRSAFPFHPTTSWCYDSVSWIFLALPFALFCVLCGPRSEEHTSELQSLMRISYAVFCLKKQKTKMHITY